MKLPSLKVIKGAVGKKGMVVAAAAAVIAVGGAGAAAYNKAVKQINDGLNYTPPKLSDNSFGIFADEKTSNVPKENTSSDVKDEPSSVPDDTSSAQESAAVSQPNVMPVNGEVIVPFSFGELVKSETLGVWKTHDGADIKADAGTPVKSMNHGEVVKIWEDALWGNCIEIDHGNGLVSCYYGMSPSMTVEEGDTVDSGQVIGMVGDTAQIEIAEPEHLHFALRRNGEWIDPISYIDPFSNK